MDHLVMRQHTSAYVSIRHTSEYVSIRQHTSAYVNIRQQTSAYRVLMEVGEAEKDLPRVMPNYVF